MLKVLKAYLCVQKALKELDKKENELWKREGKLEKEIKAYLKKESKAGKLPKSIRCVVGDYKISIPVRFGYRLTVKKV